MGTDFIEYLNSLLSKSKNKDALEKLNTHLTYFKGGTPLKIKKDAKTNPVNFYNVIKPIIETVATTSLDAMVTTTVKPSVLNTQTITNLRKLQLVADVLDGSWEHIKRTTKLDDENQRIVRDGLIYGSGVAKVYWDQSVTNGLGDVRIERIDPRNFFPDPNATTLENANYIFVKKTISRFDLINKYKNKPEILKKIKKLSTGDSQTEKGTPTNIKASMNTGDKTEPVYLEKGGLLQSDTQNIVIYECYLKDDTVLVPLDDDNESIKDIKTAERFKYPNGRVIIYSGKEILEDRPIDYPFGFPFALFSPTPSDKLFGHSLVSDLQHIQDEINVNYYKLRLLINKYKSFLFIQQDSVDHNDLKKNFDIVTARPGSSAAPPVLVTNKLVQDIQIVQQNIEQLKRDALKLARINEIMLSGERPTGVNSGKMVNELVESPMTSIREIQRNFKNYLIDLSNKAIKLIQLYYNQPRIIRLSSGQDFVQIGVDENQSPEIQMLREVRDGDDSVIQAVQVIKGDLSLGEYEIEVSAGSSLPRSQSALANTTIQLAQQGVFGDVNNIKVKELILRNLDFPNYRAIIKEMEDEQERLEQMPPPEPEVEDLIQKINFSGKDLIELISSLGVAQQQLVVDELLASLGLAIPPDQIQSPLEESSLESGGVAPADPIPPYITAIN